jgi:hypothetical protein
MQGIILKIGIKACREKWLRHAERYGGQIRGSHKSPESKKRDPRTIKSDGSVLLGSI